MLPSIRLDRQRHSQTRVVVETSITGAERIQWVAYHTLGQVN